jgi:hypothetical protein
MLRIKFRKPSLAGGDPPPGDILTHKNRVTTSDPENLPIDAKSEKKLVGKKTSIFSNSYQIHLSTPRGRPAQKTRVYLSAVG